jgi:hypothetical protein
LMDHRRPTRGGCVARRTRGRGRGGVLLPGSRLRASALPRRRSARTGPPRGSRRHRATPALDEDPGRARAAMRRARRPRPTLNPGLVATTRTLGLARGAGIAIFAIGRTAGWIARARHRPDPPRDQLGPSNRAECIILGPSRTIRGHRVRSIQSSAKSSAAKRFRTSARIGRSLSVNRKPSRSRARRSVS